MTAPKTFFTSDNHFFHRNILKFQEKAGTRQGATAEEMNELMIEKWNSQVQMHDTIYCLGDFSFRKSKDTVEILKRLKGRIHLIKGNHDMWLDDTTREYLESVDEYKEISIAGNHILMFHYPIQEWNKMHHGSFHLFGHVHGKIQTAGRSMDVGIDARPQKDMGLFEWDEVYETLIKKDILPHGDGEE